MSTEMDDDEKAVEAFVAEFRARLREDRPDLFVKRTPVNPRRMQWHRNTRRN